jgi:hypothetical protein
MWVVIAWSGGQGRELGRVASWKEAYDLRSSCTESADKVSVDDAAAWDRDCEFMRAANHAS